MRLGWVTPAGSVEVDYKRQGGVTVVPLFSAIDVALLPVVRPSVDWRAVHTAPAGRRSPPAVPDPVVPRPDRVLLAEVGRIARGGSGRGGELASSACRLPQADRRHGGASGVRPGRAIVGWLLANDKIEVSTGVPSASPVVAADGGGRHRFRLDEPWLVLAEDAEGEDRLSGWSTRRKPMRWP